ncbi:hypothetical protein TWF481_004744 [Arthrobotrys musiformis]|uniref:AHC1-like C2H2 zinc-finger domain-containing protein n=1 Tax=Arthrobotrys musiformis TaxID=47236 RepID=A0AAV9WLD4_9PEZI
MTQQPPTGVEQAGLLLTSQQQQQQPLPTPLSVAAAAPVAGEVLDHPVAADTAMQAVATAPAPAPSSSISAFSPTRLKGIAASALEQPSQPAYSPSPPPPAPSLLHHVNQPLVPHPNLKLATNFSPVLTGRPLPPNSYHAESATSSHHQPINMGSHLSKLAGSSMTPKQSPTPQPQQLQLQHQQHQPKVSTQFGRGAASVAAGKRPSMRQVSDAQDDLTAGERAARTHKIRDIISEQFGLEILLKHRELQDIEAELGRAEACLEQIRRCSIEEAMEKDGRFDDPSGITLGYAPAPEVMNGPYSRDYRDWLMEERVPIAKSKYHDVLAKDQSRNFIIQRRGEAPQPLLPQHGRPQREAAAAAAAGQKRSTICLHRQPDGTVVRLTCIDCKRDQFGSMQGFINHCRLAHQRDFQTHDHAAAVCGAPFDLTGFTGTVPPPRNNRASKHVSSASTPASQRVVKSGSSTKNSAKATTKKKASPAVVADESSLMSTGPLTPPLQAEDIALRKTIQTSHLKEYLGKKRVDVDNLDMMVEEAVNRVGIVEEESEADDEGEEEVAPVVAAGNNKKKQKATPKATHKAATATTRVAEPQVAPQPEVQLAPPAGVPQTEPPAAVRQPAHADVVMMDLTIDTSVGNAGTVLSVNDQTTPGSGAADSAYEGSEAIVDLAEPSIQVVIPAKGEEGEQSRPVSRRSNTKSAQQSPRTPVAPAATRMATRAHPSPENEGSNASRYSTRLTEVVKAVPSPKSG